MQSPEAAPTATATSARLKAAGMEEYVCRSLVPIAVGIDATGHAVVPGILFDTGKADVKDESKPALDEVAKRLGENTKLKLVIVGHTDNVGSVASNVELSKRRAVAVIADLVSKYHIAPARLDSFGNGPMHRWHPTIQKKAVPRTDALRSLSDKVYPSARVLPAGGARKLGGISQRLPGPAARTSA
jgi:OmpA family protein